MVKTVRNLFSMLVLTALLTCGLPGLTLAQAPLLDFSNTVTYGGNWAIDVSGDSPVVTQHMPSGTIAWLLFPDLELPDSFVFEAELGVISGNHPEHRPYFGLVFNKQFEDPSKMSHRGYRFTFRPSMFRYELEKRTPSSEILDFHTDVMPWAWDLEEWRTLRIVRTGDLIEAYVDDELLVSHEDGDYTGGTVGLWTYSTAAVFRNITLESL